MIFLENKSKVKVFPGQEAQHVWIGWTTSEYHSMNHQYFEDEKHVKSVIMTFGNEQGEITEVGFLLTENHKLIGAFLLVHKVVTNLKPFQDHLSSKCIFDQCWRCSRITQGWKRLW